MVFALEEFLMRLEVVSSQSVPRCFHLMRRFNFWQMLSKRWLSIRHSKSLILSSRIQIWASSAMKTFWSKPCKCVSKINTMWLCHHFRWTRHNQRSRPPCQAYHLKIDWPNDQISRLPQISKTLERSSYQIKLESSLVAGVDQFKMPNKQQQCTSNSSNRSSNSMPTWCSNKPISSSSSRINTKATTHRWQMCSTQSSLKHLPPPKLVCLLASALWPSRTRVLWRLSTQLKEQEVQLESQPHRFSHSKIRLITSAWLVHTTNTWAILQTWPKCKQMTDTRQLRQTWGHRRTMGA